MNSGILGLPTEVVAWTLTYLLHSTLLIGGVWLLLRVFPVRSNPLREGLWTVALFGGILTVSLQALVGVKPMGGELEWLPPSSAVDLATVAPSDDRAVRFVAPSSQRSPRGISPRATPGSPPVLGDAPDLGATNLGATNPGATKPGAAGDASPTIHRGPVATGSSRSRGWLALPFGLLAALLGLNVWRVRRRLRERTDVEGGTVSSELARLCREVGLRRSVRLTASPLLGSPVAFGVLRWEICVPDRALDLDRKRQRAMLAHELAHLVRRDPLRLAVCRLLETVLFFQPLNRLARRRLFEVIECRADAWAIERMGEGLTLAKCLTEVAGWLTETSGVAPRHVVAATGSPLSQRVKRLLQEDEAIAEDRRSRGLVPVLFATVPLVALLAPVISAVSSAPGAVRFEVSTEEPASRQPDTHLPDTHQPDTHLPDTHLPDTHLPDTHLPDTHLPDTHLPDTHLPDTHLPVAAHPPRAELLLEAATLLDEEIEGLSSEVEAVRSALPRLPSPDRPGIARSLRELETRVERLRQSQRLLRHWRTQLERQVEHRYDGSDGSGRRAHGG